MTSTADESVAQTTDTEQPSIINEMLDLDDFLATDVRRAEKTEILYTKPHLEAEIDALEIELQQLTDGTGAPLVDEEAAVGDVPAGGERTAEIVAAEIQDKRREYAASGKKVLLRQLASEDWMAFEQQWKSAFDDGAPYPAPMWDDLISRCAANPAMPLEKVQALRAKLGNPPLSKLAITCWDLNTKAGVSVPFSLLSSRVLRPKPPATS